MRETMIAMELERAGPLAPNRLREVERARPEPGPGELLVRVSTCAVCRTDLQLCEGDLPAHGLPIVPGHQTVGHVIAMGAGVSDFREGDRVGFAWLAGACGTCPHCKGGRENLCTKATFTGWDRDGGYATHATGRADYALRIPPEFDDAAAAPLLCGGVIGYRALKLTGLSRGQRLGLYGFGASALLTLQVARHLGMRVFVCSRSKTELARARALGAEWTGEYDESPPEPLDAAITFAPAGSVVIAALRALDRGGTVVVNAIHLDGIPAFDYDWLWWERTIRSVANFTRADAQELLDLAARIPLRPSFDLYDFREANTALERLKEGRIGGAAVLDMGR